MVDTSQDPRIERSRRVILEAVLEELGAVGYGALTIEAVAARAGVGKSTIYRYWPGKLALVEDAFRTLKAQALIPDTGSLHDRIIAFRDQGADLGPDEMGRALPCRDYRTGNLQPGDFAGARRRRI